MPTVIVDITTYSETGYVGQDPNTIVTQIDVNEVEVSFLGSLNASAQVMQSELRLKLWLAAHPDVIAVLRE